MTDKEAKVRAIAIQSDILAVVGQRREAGEQLAEVRDVMRKFREREIVLDGSIYCLSGSTPVKKKPKEVYPMLELSAGRLGSRIKGYRAELNQLIK